MNGSIEYQYSFQKCCLHLLSLSSFSCTETAEDIIKKLYRRVLGSFPTDFSLML